MNVLISESNENKFLRFGGRDDFFLQGIPVRDTTELNDVKEVKCSVLGFWREIYNFTCHSPVHDNCTPASDNSNVTVHYAS